MLESQRPSGSETHLTPATHSKKPKVLSSTEITKRAQQFAAKWKGASQENAEAQSWWNDFFAVFGVDRYSTATFERWARRASTGRRGRIDVFVPGLMIAEHKSLGRDLCGAENQADDYLAGGEIGAQEMPRYIVTSDFADVQITDLESPLDPPYRFPVSKLARNISRFAFLSGYRAPKRKHDEERAVSVKAARAMGVLYEALLGDVDANRADHEAQQASVFMTRLLFLLYGDDAEGLWDDDAFQTFILESTAEDGSDTGALIAQLFQILDTEHPSPRLDVHMALFPYVNGGLFHDRVDIPQFDSAMRAALLRATEEEWSDVSPAIFGSLFQGMASREKRHADGEHYTSEADILKTLRPLFLDEIEAEMQAAWQSESSLKRLHESFSGKRYLDPACGSGNFLIVAYREMRDIEIRLLQRLAELRGDSTSRAFDVTWDVRVTADQFMGIEINSWPAQIARTALFLTEHQANIKMTKTLGDAPEILPIRTAARIIHADALALDWDEAFSERDVTTYVFGNPPFLGKTERSPGQTASMRTVWGKDYSGEMDFVTTWFIKARRFLATRPGRFALVATNSIAQGTNVSPLFSRVLTDDWRIRFAHRSFLWKSEATGAARVHCVIVGFDRDSTPVRLFDYPTVSSSPVEVDSVSTINGYLVDAPTIYVSERSRPLNPALMSDIGFGSMAADGRHLTLTPDEAEALQADPAVARYARRFIGATELINDRVKWVLWMPEPDVDVIRSNPIIREHVEAVRAWRSAPSRDKDVAKSADYPYRFHRPKQPTDDFLCIPRHFSEDRDYATAAYFSSEYVPGDATFHTQDPDGLFFAVLSSRMFMVWQKTIGGRLKSDPRFASTLTWNTYPLPTLDNSARKRLIDAGRLVLSARADHPGVSLAKLYDPLGMPVGLRHAHDALDRVTDRLFGFAKTPTVIQRQERLFDRFLNYGGESELF
jgi:hypothetical protein